MSITNNRDFKTKKEDFKRAIYESIIEDYENLAIDEALTSQSDEIEDLKPIDIEYTDLKPEEVINLTRFLEENTSIKWGSNLLPIIALSGYSEGEPFILYLRPNQDNSGIIVFRDRIVKFYDKNISYQEDFFDEDTKMTLQKNNLPGKFNKKSIFTSLDLDGYIYNYSEEVYNNYSDLRTATYTADKKITSVIDALTETVDFIGIDEETGKDNDYNSFHIVKSYSIIGPEREEKERVLLQMLYTSSQAYLNNENPKAVRIFKNAQGVCERNFILMNNGLYIDVEKYKASGMQNSIICVRDLENILAEEKFTLHTMLEMNAWIKLDGVPCEDIELILVENKTRMSGSARVRKPNE